MKEGAKALKKDTKNNYTYTSSMVIEDNDGDDDNSGDVSVATEKKETTRGHKIVKPKNECWCGSRSHQRRSAKECPMRGWSEKDVKMAYGLRVCNLSNGECT